MNTKTLLPLFLLPSILLSQTLVLTNPALIPNGNSPINPDNPPSFISAPALQPPQTTTKSPRIHFVIKTVSLDETGKTNGTSSFSTHPAFGDKLLPDLKDLAFKPATKNNKAVPSNSWFAIILNPASSDQNFPDSTPQLIAFSPLFLSKQQLSQIKLPPSKTIFLDLTIDANGHIHSHTYPSKTPDFIKALDPEITKALAQWKFKPARQNGTPSQTQFPANLPVLPLRTFDNSPAKQTPPSAKVAKNTTLDTQPKAIRTTEPVFPYEMKRLGLEAKLTLRFTVNPDGTPSNPYITKSNNPAFEKPIIDAILKWKFKPATKDGKPVSTTMETPFVFSLQGIDGSSGEDLFSIPKPSKKEIAKMPENFRYDTPPKLISFIEPAYPYDLLVNKTSGSSTVRMIVNEKGKVTTAQIIKTTHPEFAASLLAATDHFEYTSASLNGNPANAVISYTHEFVPPAPSFFSSRSTDLQENARTVLKLIALAKENSPKILPVSELDSPPTPISQRKPRFPKNAPENTTAGNSTIEFLIDETGQAQLPRIISASDPAFGYAALQSVAHWRFTPPLKNGKPVITRVQIPLKFTPQKSPQNP